MCRGWTTVFLATALTMSGAAATGADGGTKTWLVIYDFTGEGGGKLADTLRLKLRRCEGWRVLDRISTQEMTDPTGADADADAIAVAMRKRLGVHVALYGTVTPTGDGARVEVRCIDIRGEEPGWRRTFSDDTERWRAVVSGRIAEAATGRKQWEPPEYGDQAEPNRFGEPLNANGSFEAGPAGWDAPDNVGTKIVPGPGKRGKVLRIRTDLARGPWLSYRKALIRGEADPDHPPRIGRDTGYSSVGGLEGVHYASDWIEAEAGQRYWMVADCKGLGGAKVFVKGFAAAPPRADGLPESSLAELDLTPQRFADLPASRREELIAADLKRHPERYRREVYRWYLNCGASKGAWKHFAAPVPPRGGLPDNVRWLQIQIYAYWPAGTYLFDNVHLYRDPRQKSALPEARPRTPNVRKYRPTEE